MSILPERRRVARLASTLLGICAILGCDDSSGNGEFMAGDGGEWWHLATNPSVRIGGVSADGPEALHQVQEGFVLPGDGIVIALQREILLFSGDGSFERYLGREGEGPGEYRQVSAMTRPRASGHLSVLDFSTQRITVLGIDDGVIQTDLLTPDLILPAAKLVGQPDGSFLGYVTQSLLGFGKRPLERRQEGPGYDSVVVVRLFTGGMDTISTRQSGLLVTARTGNWTYTATPPLGKKILTGIGPGIVAQGFNDEPEVTLLALDGTRFGVATVRASKHDMIDSLWSAAGRDFLRVLGRLPLPGQEQDALLRGILRDSPQPDHLPLIDGLYFDLDQNLWVRLYWPTARPERAWEVHSKEGEFLARIRMPARFEPLEIGSDYVLVLQRDDLDVETVAKYGLSRNMSGS